MRQVSRGEVLATVSAAAFAVGGLFTPTAEAGNPGQILKQTGPNLPKALGAANVALDIQLEAEGPDGCLAQEIGDGLGLKTTTQRAATVRPENIQLVARRKVRSAEFGGRFACDGLKPVKTVNSDRTTYAFEISAGYIPKASKTRVKKSYQGNVIKNVMLGTNGSNTLLKAAKKLPNKKVTNSLDSSANFGVSNVVKEYADGKLASLGESCEGGATTGVDKAGIKNEVAIIAAEDRTISGNNVSAANYASQYAVLSEAARQEVDKVIANYTFVCGSKPKPKPDFPSDGGIDMQPVDPTLPTAEVIGIDISWPQCSTTEPSKIGVTVPSLAKFGVVGVTNGLGYSANTCLKDEASKFNDLGLYVNTGFNENSVHINPNSPKTCDTTDKDCLAYNYGYNAGLYAYQAANNQGVNSLTWWLDVENDATWGIPSQNRQSIQGEKDALIASGATEVGIYSTTALWNEITGGWKNNWPSWGATTWTNPTDAKTYCTGHEFTGGKTKMIQYQGPGGLDWNVRCP